MTINQTTQVCRLLQAMLMDIAHKQFTIIAVCSVTHSSKIISNSVKVKARSVSRHTRQNRGCARDDIPVIVMTSLIRYVHQPMLLECSRSDNC